MAATTFMGVDYGATSGVAWTQWTTNSTASTATTIDPWPRWVIDCGVSTTSAMTVTNTAWVNWAINGQVEYKVPNIPTYTEEELQRQREEIAARRLAREQKDEAANRRALLLLMAILSAEQKKELTERGRFHVSARSGRRYRVSDGSHGNLSLVDEHGNVLKKLCVQPTGIPKHDVMAGQALHILDNEEEFVRRANVTSLTGQGVNRGGDDPDYAKWFAAESQEAVA